MISNSTQEPCDNCGTFVSTYDGVYFSKGDTKRFNELSWHEFGRMLMAYEGFHFKFEIFEGDEER